MNGIENYIFLLNAFLYQIASHGLLIGIQLPVRLLQIGAGPGKAPFPDDKVGGEVLVSGAGDLDHAPWIGSFDIGISEEKSGKNNGKGENYGSQVFHLVRVLVKSRK